MNHLQGFHTLFGTSTLHGSAPNLQAICVITLVATDNCLRSSPFKIFPVITCEGIPHSQNVNFLIAA